VSGGKFLTGYAGGIDRKIELLKDRKGISGFFLYS
jgi:O6-methylguanine-DNA--protein-cysteine methyltransferase